jgi:tRNA 2-selenouridine synthase
MSDLEKATVSIEEFKKHLLLQSPIIDVRAPIEFETGSIPFSVNLPILDNEERALIGTCYKQKGQDKAVELGFQIVSGENKNQKILKWKTYIENNPQTIVTCFRGGKRSQITQQFLKELGVEVLRIEKGYKQIRQFFNDELQKYSENKKMIILTGLTGSAKTHLIQKVKSYYPAIDLEALANHRGSAFGRMQTPQPAQADFENRLTTEILKIEATNDLRPILFEDESRMIGHCHIPEVMFRNLRNSKVIVVKQSLEERVENIFIDYISNVNLTESLFEYYETSLKKIEKRLGGLKMKEILTDLQKSKDDFLFKKELNSNRVWIEKLLVSYYDGLYSSSFQNRNPEILFQGHHVEISEFLKTYKLAP